MKQCGRKVFHVHQSASYNIHSASPFHSFRRNFLYVHELAILATLVLPLTILKSLQDPLSPRLHSTSQLALTEKRPHLPQPASCPAGPSHVSLENAVPPVKRDGSAWPTFNLDSNPRPNLRSLGRMTGLSPWTNLAHSLPELTLLRSLTCHS